jgi:hypothetical protein
MACLYKNVFDPLTTSMVITVSVDDEGRTLVWLPGMGIGASVIHDHPIEIRVGKVSAEPNGPMSLTAEQS